MNNVHFSSKTDDWSTPQEFFDKISLRFGGFDFDAAASETNTKCKMFSSNSLHIRWKDFTNNKHIWLNPPYGRIIGKFMEKAVEAYKDGCLVVCLVPARTDTRWWHEHVIPYAKVEFIRGRLKFGNSKNSAPFPSALVI